ncbi:hypothetical protein Si102_00212 [Streptococcus infantarius subsp. infantarius]|nr:hypothetical protein [Streptococcus infantarius subsp. infantarius]MCO4530922.1 hypothetical protein [Streptococcus infantarius subsp. infantarius]MCO4534493.1 hypothetical protein [Streptococcus infantarius subsp. infantarius]MCO4536460.1 hypothetical protein [Streptococcus infantarius subsp. infantarius]
MKKVISLMILGISLIFLASCSKQNNLDGKYYNVYDGNTKLILEINGDSGKFYKEGTHAITDVDTKNQTFTFSTNGRDYVVTYNLNEDGTLNYDTESFMTGSNKFVAYKEGSESYKEAMK